ncbi:MAG: lipopolysaccharide biosynthesis protein [Candidatus Zixiibacteriota bacterium]
MKNEDKSFRSRVVNSLIWMGTGRFAGQLISWVSTIIIIRLLSPSDYGLMAMATVFIGFLAMLSEFGITAALIQTKEIKSYEIRQIFGVVILANLAGMILTYLISPVIADFFNEDKLTTLIRFLNINYILIALYLIPHSLLIREMDFQTKAKVDITAQIGSSILMLILAFKGMGVWSLAIGAVAIHFIKMIGYNYKSSSRFYPVFRFSGAKKLIRFGLTITTEGLLYYLYMETDKVIVGRILGNQLLGVYAVASNLASMITEKILPIVTQVSFTAYSRIQHDLGKINDNLLKTTHIIAFLWFPIFYGMVGIAPEAIVVILGSKWEVIVVPFQILCLIVPFKTISVLLPPAVQAIGQPKVNMINMGITFVVMVIAFLIGVRWGIIGVCLVWVIAYPVALIVTTQRCLKALNLSLMNYLAEIKFPVIASVLMMAAILLFKKVNLVDLQPLNSLVVIVISSTIIYAGYIMTFKRSEYQKLKSFLQK